jgi:hypothetical protein
MSKEQNLENRDKALHIGDVSGSFLLRLLLSPLLFLWGCFLLAAGTLFPLPLLVMISVGGMISIPFVWLLRKSGSEINYPEPFICNYNDFEKEKNIFRDHFFGATIYLWGAFAVAYHYVKTGEIFTGE